MGSEDSWFDTHVEYYLGGAKKLRFIRVGPDSIREEWYPSGQLKHVETKFKKKLHGPMASFYENGVKSESGDFEHGQLVGKYLYFNPDGTMKSWSYRN